MPYVVAKGRRVRGFVVDPAFVLGIASNRDNSLGCPTGELPEGATLVGYDATDAGFVLWVEHESFAPADPLAAAVRRAPLRWPIAMFQSPE